MASNSQMNGMGQGSPHKNYHKGGSSKGGRNNDMGVESKKSGQEKGMRKNYEPSVKFSPKKSNSPNITKSSMEDSSKSNEHQSIRKEYRVKNEVKHKNDPVGKPGNIETQNPFAILQEDMEVSQSIDVEICPEYMQLNDLEKRELDIHSMKHVIKLHARKTFKAQPPDPPSNPLNETLMDTNLDPYPNNNPNTIPTQISSDQETFVYKLANGVEIIIFEDHFDLLEQERIAVVMYFVDKKQWPNIDDVADWSLLQSKLFLKLSEKYGIKEDPDLVIMEEESDVESENDESTAFMQLDGKGTQVLSAPFIS
ncbi:hypothetical protein L1987_56710 [Smallanthus sonchifolius]|uniref:Uncharacterized protein n=1 Tax=Smallanthus sonchifolius TaxID=185202 RepID=A0ACB9EDN1_9ASTR|nr:hypothetical protein L1987_56710 [Smallanthus sonchifolius]